MPRYLALGKELFMRRPLLVAPIVLGYTLVCLGQQSVSPIDARVSAKVEVNPTLPPTANQPDTAPAADYVLGPLDVLSIIVLELQDDTAFSGQSFRIDISGDVSLPYAGRVHAAGLTTQELQQQIAASLRRIIKEPLIRIHFHILRMIDSHNAQLVNVIHFLHRFHKSQTQLAIHQHRLIAIHLHPFAGVGNVPSFRRKPMPHHPRANNIGD